MDEREVTVGSDEIVSGQEKRVSLPHITANRACTLLFPVFAYMSCSGEKRTNRFLCGVMLCSN